MWYFRICRDEIEQAEAERDQIRAQGHKFRQDDSKLCGVSKLSSMEPQYRQDDPITDSPNELTYGCPLTAFLINVNCIKILIRPFKSNILAQNVKNRCTIMYDERFWCVKIGCCQRTNQYFRLVPIWRMHLYCIMVQYNMVQYNTDVIFQDLSRWYWTSWSRAGSDQGSVISDWEGYQGEPASREMSSDEMHETQGGYQQKTLC